MIILKNLKKSLKMYLEIVKIVHFFAAVLSGTTR